jgi:hypothetical protein
MGAPVFAYDLLRLARNPDYSGPDLEAGIATAPSYARFADAGRHVIRCIHSIPTLWDEATDSPLNEIEVYVGRAGATARHVSSRWKEHLDKKRHDHGIIALRCSTDVVDKWETAAVRAIKSLDSRGHLCVRNASASGQGSLPDTDESVIYITWAKDLTPAAIKAANKRTIDEVAREVASYTRDLGISLDMARRALEPISRPVQDRTEVAWYERHDEE